jgi:hypothetical protein
MPVDPTSHFARSIWFSNDRYHRRYFRWVMRALSTRGLSRSAIGVLSGKPGAECPARLIAAFH